MAEADPPSPPARKPRPPALVRSVEIALEGAALAFLLVSGAVIVAQQSREALVEAFAEDWLADHGVEGRVEVSRIDATGFSGRLRLGPEKDPDLIADRIDVDYAFTPPWTGAQFNISARSIRLVHPRVKLAFDGKQLQFGSLDHLVRELLARPKTNAPAPDIRVDNGEVRLTTPYGLVRADRAQANFSEARLRRLDARLLPAELRVDDATASVTGGEVHATGNGEAIGGIAALALAKAGRGDVALIGGAVTLSFSDIRYTLNGPVVGVTGVAGLQGRMASLTMGETRLAQPRFDIGFSKLQASLGASMSGRFTAEGKVAADSLSGGVSTRALNAHLQLADAKWSSSAKGFALRSPLKVRGEAAALPLDLGGTRLNVSTAKGDFNGHLDVGGPTLLAGSGSLSGSGGLSARDAHRLAAGAPVLGQEPKYAQALEAALRGFTVSAPAVDVTVGGKGLALSPRQPVTLAASSGARAVLTPKALRFDGGLSGALSASLDGGGLPAVAVEAGALSWRNETLETDARLTTTLDFGPAEHLALAAAGHARYGGSGFSFVAASCAKATVEHLELGDSDVERIAGEACPVADAPLVVADTHGWRLTGRLQGGKGEAPFAEARAQDAAGRFVVAGTPDGALSARVDVTDVGLVDTAKDLRFRPVRAKGALRLAGDIWRGELQVLTNVGQSLAQVALVQDTASGAGQADVDAKLAFTPAGLKLADLTPLVDVVDKLDGPVSFTGKFAWAKNQPITGAGRLTTTGLNLISPIGAVNGVRGDIALTGLTPLTTAKDQVVTAELIDAFLPVTAVSAHFDIAEETLNLSGAQVSAAKGRVLLDPMALSFKPGALVAGTLRLDDVQIGEIIALTSLADMVTADLVVDGQLPFESDDKGFRLLKGEIATVQPGRLAIRRDAAAEIKTDPVEIDQSGPLVTAKPEEPTNAMTDLVFQAMENVRVDSLKATVESLPSGRLGAVFSIQGVHDPKVAEKAKLSIVDLIRGKAFDRRIPLPKGTPIDLTVDSSLNLDEMLKGVQSGFDTFRELRRPSRSDPVQR